MLNKKPEVEYSEFLKLDIRVGKIISAELIPKSRNLIKTMIDIGESEPRQILAGMANYFKPEELIGKKVIILANLKPRKMMGFESNGMILAADVNNKPYLITLERDVENEVPPGAIIR